MIAVDRAARRLSELLPGGEVNQLSLVSFPSFRSSQCSSARLSPVPETPSGSVSRADARDGSRDGARAPRDGASRAARVPRALPPRPRGGTPGRRRPVARSTFFAFPSPRAHRALVHRAVHPPRSPRRLAPGARGTARAPGSTRATAAAATRSTSSAPAGISSASTRRSTRARSASSTTDPPLPPPPPRTRSSPRSSPCAARSSPGWTSSR